MRCSLTFASSYSRSFGGVTFILGEFRFIFCEYFRLWRNFGERVFLFGL